MHNGRVTWHLPRLASLTCSALLLSAQAWGGQRLPLAEALVELQSQGHRVVFSSELVPATLYVEVEQVSLNEIHRIAPQVGLELVRWNGYWLVTQATVTPAATATVERPMPSRRAVSLMRPPR